MSNTKKLISLLLKASDSFLKLGHVDIWDSDYFADELGLFCKEVSEKILDNSISLDEKKKLYYIFAPTCAFDDSVGDVKLGNQIFELLDKLYRSEVL